MEKNLASENLGTSGGQEMEFSYKSNCVHFPPNYPHTRAFNLDVHIYDRFCSETSENIAWPSVNLM